eukprot:2844399-Rhodomonas_salina.1
MTVLLVSHTVGERGGQKLRVTPPSSPVSYNRDLPPRLHPSELELEPSGLTPLPLRLLTLDAIRCDRCVPTLAPTRDRDLPTLS